MEKKKGIKTRFMAGALALMLSGAPATLVKGEEQIVKNMNRVELVEMLSTEENMGVLDTFDTNKGIPAHKYVSDDGKIEKWYISYLDKIDGLKRTDETKLVTTFLSSKEETCDIEEKHAHLYWNDVTSALIPLYCEDYLYFDDKYGMPHFKTNILTQIDENVLQFLIDYDLYRVTDMQAVIKPSMQTLFKNGCYGFAYLEPISLEDGKLTVKAHCINSAEKPYDDWLNGFLYDYKQGAFKTDPATMTEEEKTYVYEKNIKQ